MRYTEYSRKLDAIKYMAEHHRTGSPENLASRLNVSERTVIRMIRQLRRQGYPIIFDRFRLSYVMHEVE